MIDPRFRKDVEQTLREACNLPRAIGQRVLAAAFRHKEANPDATPEESISAALVVTGVGSGMVR